MWPLSRSDLYIVKSLDTMAGSAMFSSGAAAMKCPTCLKETIVKETRQPQKVRHRFIAEFSVQWPDLLIRRRKCEEHGTFVTVELPLTDLQKIAGDAWRA